MYENYDSDNGRYVGVNGTKAPEEGIYVFEGEELSQMLKASNDSIPYKMSNITHREMQLQYY